MFYVQSLLYCFSMLFIRLAILIFYHRLFAPHPVRIAISIVTSIVVGIGIASVFTSIFQCTPIRYSWNKSIGGRCLESNKHYMGGPVTSFLLDVIILILPFIPLWKLRMPTRRKLNWMFLCSVGGLWVFSSLASQSISIHLWRRQHLFFGYNSWIILRPASVFRLLLYVPRDSRAILPKKLIIVWCRELRWFRPVD